MVDLRSLPPGTVIFNKSYTQFIYVLSKQQSTVTATTLSLTKNNNAIE